MTTQEQPDAAWLAQHADRTEQRQQQAAAALRRARDIHEQAIGLHERAAELFSSRGRAVLALQERKAAQRERERLRDADAQIAHAQQAGSATLA